MPASIQDGNTWRVHPADTSSASSSDSSRGRHESRAIASASRQEDSVKSLNAWITLAMACVAAPALAQTPPAAPAPARARAAETNWWSQAGGENGPERIVWAAQKTPETPYTGVNKPIWHIADILKAHQRQAR